MIACKSLDPVMVAGVARPSPICSNTIGEDRCGYCTYTISDHVFLVGNKPENHWNGTSWDKLLDRSVILPARESYAPLKAYVINSCKASNCDAVISNWRFKLESLDVAPIELKP